MIINQISSNSLLIIFGDIISKKISQEVQLAYLNIKALKNRSIIELIPSYNSIYISFDIFVYDFINLKDLLKNKLLNKKSSQIFTDDIIQIDVYYGLEVALDLQRISKEKNICVNDIIEIHSQRVYDVYAIGFLPGFGFLGQVDDKIATPRLNSPRKKVLKGSVAIANTQTAIYPSKSSGGWNIIGNTTKKLFDKTLKDLSPLSVGKKVKFNPISKNEYQKQGGML
jgi:KipI family sensor histidine kinase inhibitor